MSYAIYSKPRNTPGQHDILERQGMSAQEVMAFFERRKTLCPSHIAHAKSYKAVRR